MKPQDSLVFSLITVIMLVVMAFTPNPEFISSLAGWALFSIAIGSVISIAITSVITMRKQKRMPAKKKRTIISSSGSHYSVYDKLDNDTVYLGKASEPYDIEKEVDNPWREKQ